MGQREKLDDLPVFPTPPAPDSFRNWRLQVGGLADDPKVFGYEELLSMQSAEVVADFACEEGWEVPGLRWTGVPLVDLINAVEPGDEARYVAIGSGDFVASLAWPDIEAGEPLVAYMLNGDVIPWEHGGPLRLVLQGGVCYQSVKWVDRIELTADSSAETASGVALARIGKASP